MRPVLRITGGAIGLALMLFLTACGGGGDDDGASDPIKPPDTVEPNPNPEPEREPEPGVVPSLIPTSRIILDASDRVLDAMLNPAGSEVAVMSQARSFEVGVSPTFAIGVYDANTGALLRSLSAAPMDTADVLDMYWGADRISVLLFGGGFITWDAVSGAIMNNVAPSVDGTCNATSPVEAFDATANVLYAADAFGQPNICEFDFNIPSVQFRPVQMPTPSTGIESIALDASVRELWVSYLDNAQTVTGTRRFDVSSFSAIGQFQSENLGAIVAAGDGFQLFDALDIVLQPVGTVLDGGAFDVSTSSQANVMAQRFSDMTRLVAIPELTYIGEIDRDVRPDRSFSANGAVGAFAIDDVVEIYALDSRGTVSAVEPATTFPGALTGTITIDGVSQTLSGTCNALVEPEVGPNIIDIAATTPDGSRFAVRAQNLLGFISYGLSEGERFTDSQAEFVHSTTLAQNFALAAPTITTDGTAITGSTLLFQFANGSFELTPDASDPTGFASRMLTLDATCN